MEAVVSPFNGPVSLAREARGFLLETDRRRRRDASNGHLDGPRPWGSESRPQFAAQADGFRRAVKWDLSRGGVGLILLVWRVDSWKRQSAGVAQW